MGRHISIQVLQIFTGNQFLTRNKKKIVSFEMNRNEFLRTTVCQPEVDFLHLKKYLITFRDFLFNIFVSQRRHWWMSSIIVVVFTTR